MLSSIADNIWDISQPIKMPGLRWTHRMTVIRLRSGDLLVHSPIELNEMLVYALQEKGQVKYLIAPSIFHDLYWPAYFKQYPQAEFYCAPGVQKEHPELSFQNILSETVSASWEDELQKLMVQGIPKLNEFVFYHSISRSLIVADLVFNFSKEQTGFGKLFLKLNGVYGRVAISRIFQMFIKDRFAFIASIEKILEWDFDRIIMGHGTIVEADGKTILKEALNRIL